MGKPGSETIRERNPAPRIVMLAMSGALGKKIKTALDETRLLILGAEILVGFHLNGAFQKGFPELAPSSRALYAFAFLNMICVVALLITPSMQHRIVEGGHDSVRILRAASRFADCALLPFAIALGIDLYIVVNHRLGAAWGIGIGAGFGALALFFWYVAEWLLRPVRHKEEPMPSDEETPLDVRVEQMLTEARVLIPGAQALFGFQLAILLTDAFSQLPGSSKAVHTAALCCIALAIILLMAPAAFHRITFAGQDTEQFHRLGSGLIIASALPLAAGIAGDFYVAIAKALDSQPIGMALALVAAATLIGLWFIYPLVLRARQGRRRRGER
jgi:hypothetical protein